MNLPSFSPPATPGEARRKNWLGLLIVVIIGVAFSIAPMVGSFTKPEANKDYSRWWRAAMDVRAGTPLQLESGEQSFIYPPASAVVFYTPLSVLGQHGMVVALCLINGAAHVMVVLVSVWFATGRNLNQHPLLYAVPVAATLGYVWDTYYLGQPNLVLLAMMLGAFMLLERARASAGVWAGVLLGAATVAKAFPATVIGLLIWRRWWVALGAMALSVVVLLLVVPGPVRGFAANARETRVWAERMLLSTSGEKLANQPNRAFRSGNQSMMSVVHRLSRDVEAAPDGKGTLRVNALSLGSRGAFAIFGVMAGVLCLAYLWAMPPRAARTCRTSGLEYSILLIFITIFSPKAGTYYFCWVLPGLTMVVAELLRSPRGSRRRTVLATGLVLALVVMASAITQAWHVYLPQALGATFWGALIVVVMLLGLLRRETVRLRGGGAAESEEELGELAPFVRARELLAAPTARPAGAPAR